MTDVQVDIPGQENEGFSYDAVGNRLSEDGVEGEWTYNANNELLTFANTEYTYDANGNATELLLNGTVMFTYHYNGQDRLVQVDDVNGSTIAGYYYDPFGRRLWKDVGGTRTYFFYADEGLVAEYDASGTEIRAYGYRPDSTWTTDPLWLKQGGEYYFYQNDHLGTPQKLVKQNGAIAWSASYTAFGEAGIEIETVTNNLRFPGQYYDVETGLHYNYHRYYASEIGRYLRTDLIGFHGGKNFFLYSENNPITFEDPWGLKCVTKYDEMGAYLACDDENDVYEYYRPVTFCVFNPLRAGCVDFVGCSPSQLEDFRLISEKGGYVMRTLGNGRYCNLDGVWYRHNTNWFKNPDHCYTTITCSSSGITYTSCCNTCFMLLQNARGKPGLSGYQPDSGKTEHPTDYPF